MNSEARCNYRGKMLIHAGKSIDKQAMDRVKKFNIGFLQSRLVAEVEIKDCIQATRN